MPDSMFGAQPHTTSDRAGLSDLDDRALLEAHLAGDRDAFAVLARRYRALMLFIAQRIVRELADPEDVVQSALLGVFRSAGSFDHRASVKTWIARITRNAAFDARRRRLARPTCELTGYEPEAADVIDVAGVARDRTMVDELLAELPESNRQVVVMIDLLDLDYETVARILRVPVGTVKSRRARGVRALAERVARVGRAER